MLRRYASIYLPESPALRANNFSATTPQHVLCIGPSHIISLLTRSFRFIVNTYSTAAAAATTTYHYHYHYHYHHHHHHYY